MGKTFKEKPFFKKTKRPKKGAFWGEGRKGAKLDEVLRREEK